MSVFGTVNVQEAYIKIEKSSGSSLLISQYQFYCKVPHLVMLGHKCCDQRRCTTHNSLTETYSLLFWFGQRWMKLTEFNNTIKEIDNLTTSFISRSFSGALSCQIYPQHYHYWHSINILENKPGHFAFVVQKKLEIPIFCFQLHKGYIKIVSSTKRNQ